MKTRASLFKQYISDNYLYFSVLIVNSILFGDKNDEMLYNSENEQSLDCYTYAIYSIQIVDC